MTTSEKKETTRQYNEKNEREPNTYASCGRNDPARKRRLNRIPACRHSFNEGGEEKCCYGKSDCFDKLSNHCRRKGKTK